MDKKSKITNKIIQAATIEFGSKGYTLASTNQIHQMAKVGKGTIFLYFFSKAELFYAVFIDCINRLLEKMQEHAFNDIEDVYERMLAAALWKQQYFLEYPHDSKVLLEAIANPPIEISQKIGLHMEKLTVLSLSYFFDDIDMNRFSEEYSKEEVIRYIQMTLNGIQSIMKNEHITLEYITSIRDDAMKYLKTVLKGMEK